MSTGRDERSRVKIDYATPRAESLGRWMLRRLVIFLAILGVLVVLLWLVGRSGVLFGPMVGH